MLHYAPGHATRAPCMQPLQPSRWSYCCVLPAADMTVSCCPVTVVSGKQRKALISGLLLPTYERRRTLWTGDTCDVVSGQQSLDGHSLKSVPLWWGPVCSRTPLPRLHQIVAAMGGGQVHLALPHIAQHAWCSASLKACQQRHTWRALDSAGCWIPQDARFHVVLQLAKRPAGRISNTVCRH